MTDLMIWALIIYLFVGVCWFVITLLNWSIDRDFRSLHTDEEIAAKALLVLQTPIWPLIALEAVGRTIANLQKDVMKP